MSQRSLSPTRSLRARFAVLMGLAGLLFGVIITGVLEWRLESFTFDAQHRALKLAANEISLQLAKDLRARRREIVLAARLLEQSQHRSESSVRDLLESLRREQSSYAWIGLTDPRGIVLGATDGLLEGQDTSARPWFAGAQQGVYLGDPHEAKLLARYMPAEPDSTPVRFVDVAVAMRDSDGQFLGVLCAHLHWSWVWPFGGSASGQAPRVNHRPCPI